MTSESYLAGHVEEALAHAGETDVHVAVADGRLVLTGTVATEGRRTAVAEIAASLAADLDVANEVAVVLCGEPWADEDVP